MEDRGDGQAMRLSRHDSQFNITEYCDASRNPACSAAAPGPCQSKGWVSAGAAAVWRAGGRARDAERAGYCHGHGR